ncbi:hypothetical protein DFH08DRAFT_945555 [Mycena albidolilacea]|uniref:Uncharacterized protein n=1 Tax=Mycena albidolilacea TaxID=1033008 RepID=A0AAD6Z166_9AGAR|nr:hypothetical protein DFH08DRAFT_945555 [Mycena albidolilacea]
MSCYHQRRTRGSSDQIPDIEKALLKIDEPGQLPIHQDALVRLNASIAFKSSDHDSLDTARLVETGAKRLTQLFTKLVAEASTGSTPSPNEEISAAPFLPAIMGTLPSLVVFTHTAPFPASPSHPAAPAILSIFKAAQKGYADMRGIWSRKCLETQGKRSIDRADTVDSIVAGKDFGRWLESLLSVADEEDKCIKDLGPLSTSNVVASPYNALLNPILFLFSTTLTSLIALIKRLLQKYSTPPLRSPRTRRCLHCSRAGTPFAPDSRNFNANERKTGWARCGRSSPEFPADIEMVLLAKNVPGTETSVGVVERCQVHGAAAAALQLGDGNWKMGEGVTVGTDSKLCDGDDDDEQFILEHFIYDVVTTAIISLTSNSRTQRRPAHGSTLRTASFTTFSPIAPAPRLRPPALVCPCVRLFIELPELILHRRLCTALYPAARVVRDRMQQREARIEVRCGPALAGAAAQRVLHALREELVEQRLVVLLSSAVLGASSLYRASEIYQAIEPSDDVERQLRTGVQGRAKRPQVLRLVCGWVGGGERCQN